MVNQPSLFDTRPVKEEIKNRLGSFYNTIHIEGKELSIAKQAAAIRDNRVLGIIQTYGKMTPIKCWTIYCENHDPILLTSIRRSMTDLTDLGKLIKLNEKKKEKYGKVNHLWEAN